MLQKLKEGNNIMFQKAQRKSIKLSLALTGPSGAGKTFSALTLAKGLGKKIAVIDTENGSASLYSDKFEFDVVELTPPFTTLKYIDAINFAEKSGYDVLIIDSLSHAWAGEGGLLQEKESLDQRGGNSYTNWATITKKHEAFKSAFLHSNIHIITTMRSKQDYVIEINEKGKQAPKKVGLAPIQRDGIEYEFTIVFDIAINHECVASKDRTNIFHDSIFKITEDTGASIKKWLQMEDKNLIVSPKQNQTTTEIQPLKDETTQVDKLKNILKETKTMTSENVPLVEEKRENFIEEIESIILQKNVPLDRLTKAYNYHKVNGINDMPIEQLKIFKSQVERM